MPPVAGTNVAGALPETLEDLDRRELAGSVRAEEREDLPPAYLEVDTADRLCGAEPLAQPARTDDDITEPFPCGGDESRSVTSTSVLRSFMWTSTLGAKPHLVVGAQVETAAPLGSTSGWRRARCDSTLTAMSRAPLGLRLRLPCQRRLPLWSRRVRRNAPCNACSRCSSCS
jgi:hypothetical protein